MSANQTPTPPNGQTDKSPHSFKPFSGFGYAALSMMLLLGGNVGNAAADGSSPSGVNGGGRLFAPSPEKVAHAVAAEMATSGAIHARNYNVMVDAQEAGPGTASADRPRTASASADTHGTAASSSKPARDARKDRHASRRADRHSEKKAAGMRGDLVLDGDIMSKVKAITDRRRPAESPPDGDVRPERDGTRPMAATVPTAPIRPTPMHAPIGPMDASAPPPAPVRHGATLILRHATPEPDPVVMIGKIPVAGVQPLATEDPAATAVPGKPLFATADIGSAQGAKLMIQGPNRRQDDAGTGLEPLPQTSAETVAGAAIDIVPDIASATLTDQKPRAGFIALGTAANGRPARGPSRTIAAPDDGEDDGAGIRPAPPQARPPIPDGPVRAASSGSSDGLQITTAALGAFPMISKGAPETPATSRHRRLFLEMAGNAIFNMLGATTSDHISANIMRDGIALLAMPIYQPQNAWGENLGNFRSDWQDGLALGTDVSLNTTLSAGVHLSIGGGLVVGAGSFSDRGDGFGFWGVSGYAGITMDNFAIGGDITFATSRDALEADDPPEMLTGKFVNETRGRAVSIGVHGEYRIATRTVDIVPHAGMRLLHLDTAVYDVQGDRQIAVPGSELQQRIWSYPVGVTFTKDMTLRNGWSVSPKLDLSVIPAVGDRNARTALRFDGTRNWTNLDAAVMGDISYQGMVGLDFAGENLAIGLNYTLTASRFSTAHGVFGTIRFEF
ncbi:MAG: autotransporter outer membrane beta-barrel domain-containing protein [Desulfovibrio sp.]|jgi:hypothetical protein|nr:autotransporter outer membrane beta-barrel domain-containing protein [Desulfovibrio sp.]